MHARKMTAALQWASSSPNPILLRSVPGVGHGPRSASRSVELTADGLAFLAHETRLSTAYSGGPLTLPPDPARHWVTSLGELRAIADGLRLRVLDLLMADVEQSWSVRELAEETGCAVNRMHYHVRLLEEQAFVRVDWVATNRGHRERRYVAAQKEIWFARGGATQLQAGA
jgi:predicted transcriptional regulator